MAAAAPRVCSAMDFLKSEVRVWGPRDRERGVQPIVMLDQAICKNYQNMYRLVNRHE